jgi:thiol:disulfide interchange protein DsbD
VKLIEKKTHIYILGLVAFFVTSLLAIGALAAEGPAPQTALVKKVPVIKGYPAGRITPLFLIVRLPVSQMAMLSQKGLQLKMEPAPGLELVSVKLLATERISQEAGAGVIRLELKAGDQAAPGPRWVAGKIGLSLKEERLDLPFGVEILVLPQGQSPTIVIPEMLSYLMQGGSKAGAASPPKPGPAMDPYAGRSVWWILLAVFAGGLALNLTPCVYPLIPITVSFFGGRAQGSRGLLVANALLYWAGLVTTYTVLGAFVALSGRMLGEALTSPWVTLVIVGVLVAMAASMFGFWELRLPSSLNRVASASRTGLLGTLVMGLTVGLLAAPCVGPFVVGLMTHVAQAGQVGYGLIIFFCLSLGLGLPLTVLAFFSGAATRLPGAGDWMVWVRALFGVILCLMAVYVAKPLLENEAFVWLLALTGAVGGIYLGFIQKSGRGRFVAFKRLAGVLLLGAAAIFWFVNGPLNAVTPGAGIAWTQFSPQALREAAADKKPVMIDIAADWCAPCKRMEAHTFPDPRVVEAAKDFANLKMDVTTGPPANARTFVQKWQVRGVPTIIFLDQAGRWIPELTIVGYVGPEVLLDRLKLAKAKSKGEVTSGGG